MKPTYSLAAALAAFFLTAHSPLRASESQTDQRIESSFTETYVYRTYLDHDAIKARAKDGNVILTGKVSEPSHKDLAAETMENLPGVKSVDNRLKVKGDRPVENSDEWIRMKVETGLLFHRNVSVTHTKVMVKDGVVTLRGQADNQAQKDLTSQYAADVDGVNVVKNKMIITQPEPSLAQKTIGNIDDASITAEIKVSLLAHRSTSALDTHVKTEAGVVTVSGKAGNAAEKELVTKLASDIDGVKSVVNNMVVSAAVSEN